MSSGRKPTVGAAICTPSLGQNLRSKQEFLQNQKDKSCKRQAHKNGRKTKHYSRTNQVASSILRGTSAAEAGIGCTPIPDDNARFVLFGKRLHFLASYWVAGSEMYKLRRVAKKK